MRDFLDRELERELMLPRYMNVYVISYRSWTRDELAMVRIVDQAGFYKSSPTLTENRAFVYMLKFGDVSTLTI